MNFYDFKEDWDNVKKRWEAWWDFDMRDRPLICVAAPKQNPCLSPELENFKYEETNLERKWTDAGYLTDRMSYIAHNTYYGGESVPVFQHGWSVGHALPFGCEPVFAQNTVWIETVPVRDGEKYPDIYFDENNRWWKLILENTHKIALAGKQQYFVMPMWGNHAGDNLSLCRGTENLLCDLIENPLWVKENVKYISDAMIKQFEELNKFTQATGLEGHVNYVDCWSPKKTCGFDTDFSYMISPEHFKEIFLPPLIETMRTVEHRIYHLDGVMAMRNHLDTLLDVGEINAFQWVPGDGQWEPMQWIPLLQKMQARKKSVFCYAPFDAVVPIIKELRPEGLCISTYAATEDDARRLIENVERLYN